MYKAVSMKQKPEKQLNDPHPSTFNRTIYETVWHSRRIMVHAGMRKKARPYLQNNHSKKGWTHGSRGRMPTSKHKVLSSNPSTQILFWESPYEDEE
jgi:hypothetical protein